MPFWTAISSEQNKTPYADIVIQFDFICVHSNMMCENGSELNFVLWLSHSLRIVIGPIEVHSH